MRKAVFFDRDGVLIKDHDLQINVDNIFINEDIIPLIDNLLNKNYIFFMVTNQTVISRGISTEDEVNKLNRLIESKIKSILPKFYFNKIYICPHHPHAQIEKYRIDCDCRKPLPGMINKAVVEFNIDVKSSFMIGDRPSDICAGKLAGSKTVLYKSGMHTNNPIISNKIANYENITPNFQVNSFKELIPHV